jgi:DNA-binding PadR family transcriptional regulator
VTGKQRRSNLLALATLSTLSQRPMHRYEMASIMRARGKDQDLAVKFASLYTVVQSLEKQGLVETIGTSREGARPERTVYRITAAGREEFAQWTRELLADPRPEATRFVAGLSVLGGLPPGEVIEALQTRSQRLQESIKARRSALAEHKTQVPALFLLEDEFGISMLEAEATWVQNLLKELTSARFPGLDEWQNWHDTGQLPAELAELAERGAERSTDTEKQ